MAQPICIALASFAINLWYIECFLSSKLRMDPWLEISLRMSQRQFLISQTFLLM